MSNRKMTRDEIRKALDTPAFPGMDKGATLVVSDSGNGMLKTLCHDGRSHIIPHHVIRLSDKMWAKETARAQYSRTMSGKTQKFSMLNRETKEWENYIIGDEASNGRQSRRLGSEKYQFGYFQALIVAQLLMYYPEGHDNVILALAHPPSEDEHVMRIIKIAGGVHRALTVDGRKVQFVVRQVIPFDEPMGGVAWMNIRTNGKDTLDEFGRIQLTPGMRILTIDVGSWLGSIGPAIVNEQGLAVPIWNEYKPIPQGIINTMEALERELKSEFTEEFRGMSTIPHHLLSEAMQTSNIYLSGNATPLNVADAVNRACTIVDEIESIYNNHFQAGRPYRAVFVTGGAIRDMYKPLKEVIKHSSFHPVDTLSQIVMANCRGGFEIALSVLEANR